MSARFLFLPLAVLATASAAAAQAAPISAVGPFTGTDQESFEGKSIDPGSLCILERTFNAQADVCPLLPLFPAILSNWGAICTSPPKDGAVFYASKGSGYRITFDTPISRFGGYFTTSNLVPDGRISFYDAGGALITSMSISAPNNCQWVWNGWQVSFGAAIGSVELVSNEPNGEFLALDALEADFAPAGTLQASTDQVSVGAGGSMLLSLDLDDAHAGLSYLILGSVSGTAPGLPYGGALVPLNPDAYFLFTLLSPNTPPLVGGGGTLDSSAQGSAVFSLPPLSDPALVGVSVAHAGFAIDLVGGFFVLPEVSNAVSATLVP